MYISFLDFIHNCFKTLARTVLDKLQSIVRRNIQFSHAQTIVTDGDCSKSDRFLSVFIHTPVKPSNLSKRDDLS